MHARLTVLVTGVPLVVKTAKNRAFSSQVPNLVGFSYTSEGSYQSTASEGPSPFAMAKH